MASSDVDICCGYQPLIYRYHYEALGGDDGDDG